MAGDNMPVYGEWNDKKHLLIPCMPFVSADGTEYVCGNYEYHLVDGERKSQFEICEADFETGEVFTDRKELCNPNDVLILGKDPSSIPLQEWKYVTPDNDDEDSFGNIEVHPILDKMRKAKEKQDEVRRNKEPEVMQSTANTIATVISKTDTRAPSKVLDEDDIDFDDDDFDEAISQMHEYEDNETEEEDDSMVLPDSISTWLDQKDEVLPPRRKTPKTKLKPKSSIDSDFAMFSKNYKKRRVNQNKKVNAPEPYLYPNSDVDTNVVDSLDESFLSKGEANKRADYVQGLKAYVSKLEEENKRLAVEVRSLREDFRRLQNKNSNFNAPNDQCVQPMAAMCNVKPSSMASPQVGARFGSTILAVQNLNEAAIMQNAPLVNMICNMNDEQRNALLTVMRCFGTMTG